jgi:hypothetical protein
MPSKSQKLSQYPNRTFTGGGSGSDLMLNVKDFGALGDGVTDDSDAMRAAATAAASKTLYFPAGIYIFYASDPATPGGGGMHFTGDNTHVVANGAIIKFENSNGSPTNERQVPGRRYDSCMHFKGNDCSLSGIHIVGMNAPYTYKTATGIAVMAGYGVTETPNTSTDGFTIRDCRFDGIGSVAIWINNVNKPSVIGCEVRNCKADGIHFSDGCTGVVCTDNIVYKCEDDHIALVNDFSQASEGANTTVRDFVVANNVITGEAGLWGIGILLGNAMKGVVTGNVIKDTVGSGIMMYSTGSDPVPENHADKVLITGNVIEHTGLPSAATPNFTTDTNSPWYNSGHPANEIVQGCGICIIASQVITVANNVISNMIWPGENPAQPGSGSPVYPSGGIYCSNARILTIKENYFYDNATDAVHFTHNYLNSYYTQLNIIGNSFNNTSRNHIWIYSPPAVGNYLDKISIMYNTYLMNATLRDVTIDAQGTELQIEYSGAGLVAANCANRNRVKKSRFHAYSGADQWVSAGAYATLITQSLIYDVNGDFNTGSSSFLAPAAGYYVFNAGVFFSPGAASDFGLSVFKNGVLFQSLSFQANAGTLANWQQGEISGVSAPMLLARGDSITIGVYVSVTMHTTAGSPYVYFGGYAL